MVEMVEFLASPSLLMTCAQELKPWLLLDFAPGAVNVTPGE